jgi:2-oxoglutarate ferredoxin oxidoreductase subunit gamma
MYADLIIAGFGGQGIMLAGNLLAYAAMQHGLNATFIPVYGPEMRGGTANCTVVVSDQEIGSPIVHRPMGLIVLNRPSLEKYLPRLKDNGLCVINTSLIPVPEDTSRIKATALAAGDIADKLGNARMTNMVALGAYLKVSGTLPLDRVQDTLKHVVSAHYGHLIAKNAEALQAGYDAV